jgi:hypothetical protein
MADVNGLLKATITGTIGLIPEVGALVSSLAAFFWPDAPVDYWAQVKDQVMSEIKSGLRDYRVEELKNAVNGTQENVEKYNEIADSTGQEKKTSCVALDAVLTQIKPQFLKDDINVLSYLVQFAVLHISISVDRYLLYKTTENQKNLKEFIDAYSDHAHLLVPKAVQSRVDQVDSEPNFNTNDQNVYRDFVREGSGWSLRIAIYFYGTAWDHKTGAKMKLAHFKTAYTMAMSPPRYEDVAGGVDTSRRQLNEYRDKVDQS